MLHVELTLVFQRTSGVYSEGVKSNANVFNFRPLKVHGHSEIWEWALQALSYEMPEYVIS